MRLNTKIAATCAAVAWGVGGIIVTATPAEAAWPTSISICNSSYSDASIKAYNNDAFVEKYVGPGTCVSISDKNGMARVDTEIGDGINIMSWRKRRQGEPWEPCVDHDSYGVNPYSTGSPLVTQFEVNALNNRCI